MADGSMTLVDLDYDAAQRDKRISELALPSGSVCSMMGNRAVETCADMLDLFDRTDEGPRVGRR